MKTFIMWNVYVKCPPNLSVPPLVFPILFKVYIYLLCPDLNFQGIIILDVVDVRFRILKQRFQTTWTNSNIYWHSTAVLRIYSCRGKQHFDIHFLALCACNKMKITKKCWCEQVSVSDICVDAVYKISDATWEITILLKVPFFWLVLQFLSFSIKRMSQPCGKH